MKVVRKSSILTVLTLTALNTLAAMDISTVISRLALGFVDDENISELKETIQKDPTAPLWWAWLGYAHSLRREWVDAENAYHQAFQLGAKPSFPWFPPTLPVSWLPKHVNLPPLTINGLTIWQSPLVFYEPNFATDPKHGERFHRTLFVYNAERQGQFAQQVVQWMVQSGDLPPHLSDAPSIFAAALQLFSERFNIPLKLPIKGWLFTKGNGSAFSFAGHTLFYGTIPNDRWSWWLKVAHEAGHHTVPAFGEFDGFHEPYSGGFLGERLFAVWLWDAEQKTQGIDEMKQKLSEYLLKVVSAEIVKAQQWMLQSPENAQPTMQVFLGLCLYLERLGGYELLREVMANSTNDSWNGFQTGLERTFTERLQDGLKIRLRVPDANTPLSTFDIIALRDGLKSQAIQLAWWLPKGEFQCDVEVQGNGILQLRWGESQIAEQSVNANEPQTFSHNFVNPSSGWQRLRFWWLKGEGKIFSVIFWRKQ